MFSKLYCWVLDLVGRFIKRETADQFIKFCVVGAINTVVDFGIYLALTRLTEFWSLHLVFASAISFTVAVCCSFILNTFWTFRCAKSGWRKRAMPFFIVALGGLFVNAGTVLVIITLGVWDVIAKIVATAVVLAWNFTLQKKWTFKMK